MIKKFKQLANPDTILADGFLVSLKFSLEFRVGSWELLT